MTKKATGLPKFEDWKAPWEVDSEGNDLPEESQNFDAAAARKRIYDLMSDKNRLQTSRDEVTTRVEELETQISELGDPADLKKLQDELEQTRQERDAAKGDIKALQFEVALEKGLTKRQALRLIGKDREELEADAEALLEDLGVKSDQNDGRDPELDPRGKPRTRGHNPADPNPDADSTKELTPEEFAKKYYELR